MASISPDALAAELLERCLAGAQWPDGSLRRLVECATHADPERAAAGSRALFRDLVESLSDAFEPALCDTYASLFSAVIAKVLPQFKARDLVERYRRVRIVRRYDGSARRVIVLSRVTLGADVAVTSVILDAAKKRFPGADIDFACGQKSWELFEGDPGLRHLPLFYGRSATLLEGLAVWRDLQKALDDPASVVIDPDSRLTQLGLLPVCPEEKYLFFESRSYGGDGAESLSTLTKRWVGETLGVEDASAYIAPAARPEAGERIAISFGVGENPAKRVPDPFEEELLRSLSRRNVPMLIDKGAGGEEAERVERAIARSGAPPGQIETWYGAFAPFAARVARSRLYVGYDSAGQHVAAACGVPLITIFAGFTSPRMFERWHPSGPGPIEVIRVGRPDADEVLHRTRDAIARMHRYMV